MNRQIFRAVGPRRLVVLCAVFACSRRILSVAPALAFAARNLGVERTQAVFPETPEQIEPVVDEDKRCRIERIEPRGPLASHKGEFAKLS